MSHRGRGRGVMKRTAAWLAVEDESKGDDSDDYDGGMSYESDMEDDDFVRHPCPKRMLSVVCCLLSVVCCLLSVVCCLLSVVLVFPVCR